MQVLLGPSCILETLDLRSNLIGDGGAQLLATALSTNTRLTKLILFENKISHFGATCLYQALQSNTALETLDISNNLVGRAETVRLAAAPHLHPCHRFAVGFRLPALTRYRRVTAGPDVHGIGGCPFVLRCRFRWMS